MSSKIIYLLVLFNFPLISQVVLDVPKFRIYPSTITQTEPVVATNPQNSSMIFVSARTFTVVGAFQSEGVYISTDGGYSWNGNDTCTGALITNHGGDPGVAITDSSRLILSHIGNLYPGMYSNYSNDMGENWSNNHTITSNTVEDKGTLAIDHSVQSDFNNRLYLAYVDYINISVQISLSTDKGINWSQPVQVNPSPPTRSTGSSIAISTDSRVYLCWAGVTSTYPFNEDYIGFAKSTDGGVSWNVNQNIIDMNGIFGVLTEKSNIRVNGLPQIERDNTGGVRNGWLYIITTEKNNPPAGSDPDIILHRSTNDGVSWSSGIRVNLDPVNDGKIQYFPYLDVDNQGNINILFYDDRYTTSDSAMVFIAHSTDGGNSWNEYEITNTTFKPEPIAGTAAGYQGDHIALISRGDYLNAFWMADYSGIYQVWSVVIHRDILGIKDQVSNTPASFKLYQNYPNPFNPSTTIKYSVGEESFITLKIYDSLGREVKTLVNRLQNSGEYEVSFNLHSFSSGIYFYTLRSGNFQATQKMLLLR